MSEQEPTPAVRTPVPTGLLLAPITLIWLAGMLWSARATIASRTDAEMAVTSTAYALPGAVSASLVSGAAVSLAVLSLVARRWTLGATARPLTATCTGLLVGLLSAVPILTINNEGWVYAVVGGTVAAAATIGGALGGIRAPVVAAVCWAAIVVFAVGFVLNLFQNPVLDALGSADTQASQASAARLFAFGTSLVSGVAAGLIAYAVLRRAGRRDAVSWPFYALAGAGPGLLLVVAEVLTRTAGARVLDLAGKVSELELTVQQMLSAARFNNALIVLFAGAITAVIAIGRTIGPAKPTDDSARAATVSDTAAVD